MTSNDTSQQELVLQDHERIQRLETIVESTGSQQKTALKELQELKEQVKRATRLGEDKDPWARPLRDLEHELKRLLASQVEDSTQVFRSMAMMVEELREESRRNLFHSKLLPVRPPHAIAL